MGNQAVGSCGTSRGQIFWQLETTVSGYPAVGVCTDLQKTGHSGSRRTPTSFSCFAFIKDETPGSWEYANHFLLFGVHKLRDTKKLGVRPPFLVARSSYHHCGSNWLPDWMFFVATLSPDLVYVLLRGLLAQLCFFRRLFFRLFLSERCS